MGPDHAWPFRPWCSPPLGAGHSRRSTLWPALWRGLAGTTAAALGAMFDDVTTFHPPARPGADRGRASGISHLATKRRRAHLCRLSPQARRSPPRQLACRFRHPPIRRDARLLKYGAVSSARRLVGACAAVCSVCGLREPPTGRRPTGAGKLSEWLSEPGHRLGHWSQLRRGRAGHSAIVVGPPSAFADRWAALSDPISCFASANAHPPARQAASNCR